MANETLLAGAACLDITPETPMFLFGYPHVERISKGVNDPLLASALVLDNGDGIIAFCALDLIFVTKAMAQSIRNEVSLRTGIPPGCIMISATHTHSGPITADMLSNRNDATVPPVDPLYIAQVVDIASRAIIQAWANRVKAEMAHTRARVDGVGGNRHHADGISDPDVPILVVRGRETGAIMALSVTYCMHPTVLHEDSKMISSDFPGSTRDYLRKALGGDLVCLYHTGPSGNQSPRHFVKANTFDEAERLGRLLGAALLDAVKELPENAFSRTAILKVAQEEIALPRREFSDESTTRRRLQNAVAKLKQLREAHAPAAEIRTAECDWFGAEEAVALALTLVIALVSGA